MIKLKVNKLWSAPENHASEGEVSTKASETIDGSVGAKQR